MGTCESVSTRTSQFEEKKDYPPIRPAPREQQPRIVRSRSPPSHTHHDRRRTLILHRRTDGNAPDGTRPSHEGCPMGIRRASPCAQADRHANAGGHIHPVTVSVSTTLTVVRTSEQDSFSCLERARRSPFFSYLSNPAPPGTDRQTDDWTSGPRGRVCRYQEGARVGTSW